jgi:hypothetical protein
MVCKCGGEWKVALSESGAIFKCDSCGRGEHILQAKPQEVFDYRERVTRMTARDDREMD